MSNRHDVRFLNHHDDLRAVLIAWWNELAMGAWADNDEDAFRVAVEDELRHIWDNTEQVLDLSLISIEEV